MQLTHTDVSRAPLKLNILLILSDHDEDEDDQDDDDNDAVDHLDDNHDDGDDDNDNTEDGHWWSLCYDSTGDEMPLEKRTPLCVLTCANNGDPSELTLVKSGTTSSIFVSFALGLWLIKYNFNF